MVNDYYGNSFNSRKCIVSAKCINSMLVRFAPPLYLHNILRRCIKYYPQEKNPLYRLIHDGPKGVFQNWYLITERDERNDCLYYLIGSPWKLCEVNFEVSFSFKWYKIWFVFQSYICLVPLFFAIINHSNNIPADEITK